MTARERVSSLMFNRNERSGINNAVHRLTNTYHPYVVVPVCQQLHYRPNELCFG